MLLLQDACVARADTCTHALFKALHEAMSRAFCREAVRLMQAGAYMYKSG